MVDGSVFHLQDVAGGPSRVLELQLVVLLVLFLSFLSLLFFFPSLLKLLSLSIKVCEFASSSFLSFFPRSYLPLASFFLSPTSTTVVLPAKSSV